ncbi:MAG: hypothetical protein E4G94_09365 [ANME-2 cluster archaeon]|nr:MAG: hypothetical protein E4G94_09365 [ANME-2 cluster archaeon]
MKKDENEQVDSVSAGLVIIIIGLLLVQFSTVLSDLSYTQRVITGYEDKTTRIPDQINPLGFIILGFLISIIGCAIFLRNFINQFYEMQILARYEEYTTKKFMNNHRLQNPH